MFRDYSCTAATGSPATLGWRTPFRPEAVRPLPARDWPDFVRLPPSFVRDGPSFVRARSGFVRDGPSFVRARSGLSAAHQTSSAPDQASSGNSSTPDQASSAEDETVCATRSSVRQATEPANARPNFVHAGRNFVHARLVTPERAWLSGDVGSTRRTMSRLRPLDEACCACSKRGSAARSTRPRKSVSRRRMATFVCTESPAPPGAESLTDVFRH